MSKLTLPYVEFYISNVCNLACPGCNRFNNYKFTGYQRWSDYADQYAQWADQVTIQTLSILGGEPLLNVTFMDWVTNVNKLWPDSFLRIITNGFHLNKVQGLYDLVKSNRQIQIWVGIHNKQHKRKIFDIIDAFMVKPIRYEFNQTNPYMEYMWVTDSNGVKIKIEYNWWFHQGSIINNGLTQTLHQSNPKKAHDNCHMKTCHHFIRGNLYKCGVVALLPEYNQQHKLSLNDDDYKLMHSYQPLTLDHSHEEKVKFIQQLPNQIDQCRFCPETYHGDMIYAQEKKELKKQS